MKAEGKRILLTRGRLILLGKALGICAALVGAKLLMNLQAYDQLMSGTLMSGLVAGVFFTIAAVFGGVLADFKEAEKIPGELAAILKSLHRDARAAYLNDEPRARALQDKIRQVLEVVLANFDHNTWKMREINIAIESVVGGIDEMTGQAAAAPYVLRMRSDLNGVEKICNRIETIIETSFIPAAYIVSWVATGIVLVTLLITRTESSYESVVIYGAVAFILVALNLLIRDMDNPFETGGKSAADVDLSHLRKLQKLLADNGPENGEAGK